MKIYSAFLLSLLTAPCFAQVLTNNGSTANILSGTVISNAGVQNNSGTIINLGTAQLKGVTLQSGSTFTNNALVKISGTMGGTGSLTSTGATVEINGTSAQSIPAGFFTANMVKNLTTNNSAGITLNGALGIKNTLLASGGTFNANGYLTLLSDSSATALIDGSGAGSVTGNVRMQRYLSSGFGYKFISSPFQSSTVAELANDVSLNTNFATVYGYDENLLSAGWVIDTASSVVLNPMSGYAINCGSLSAAKTIDISGVVNNGNINKTLYNHNRTYTLGFNLVGNPYPSPVDWNAAGGWTKVNIDNAIYYFNNGTANQYQGSYATYINGVSSDGIASNIIPSMQGFFVHVSNGSYPVTATLGINNTARVNTFTPVFHKQTSQDYPLVRLSAGYENGNGLADPTVVYFDGMATQGFEQDRDAIKLLNTDQRIPNLYSIVANRQLAINAIPTPDESSQSVPLGLKTEQDGSVTFRISEIKDKPAGLHIYLADAERGVTLDLEDFPGYSVHLSKSSYEHRFSLVFSRQAGLNAFADELSAYVRGNTLFVTLQADKGTLTVNNLLGQAIQRVDLTGQGLHEISLDAPAGLYVVSVTTTSGKKSRKITLGE